MRKAFVWMLGAAMAMALPASAQEFRLLMIEQTGCYVCAAFNRDVAPAYETSPEARRAPLIRADLHGALPEGVVLDSRPFVTPTFVLIGADGHEAGRLIGFPGEDFFWGYVNEMMDLADSAASG